MDVPYFLNTFFYLSLGLLSSLRSFPQSVWIISQGENEHSALHAQNKREKVHLYIFSLWMLVIVPTIDILCMSNCHLLSPHILRILIPPWFEKPSMMWAPFVFRMEMMIYWLNCWPDICYSTLQSPKIEYTHPPSHGPHTRACTFYTHFLFSVLSTTGNTCHMIKNILWLLFKNNTE